MEKDDYSYENLKKFKYLEKVFKEIIRMYGPVPGWIDVSKGR
jgi:cytochrome P450